MLTGLVGVTAGMGVTVVTATVGPQGEGGVKEGGSTLMPGLLGEGRKAEGDNVRLA